MCNTMVPVLSRAMSSQSSLSLPVIFQDDVERTPLPQSPVQVTASSPFRRPIVLPRGKAPALSRTKCGESNEGRRSYFELVFVFDSFTIAFPNASPMRK